MLVEDMLHIQREVQALFAHHKGNMVLPDADAILLPQHVDNVLVKYSLRANSADKEGRVLFKVAPKHNYV